MHLEPSPSHALPARGWQFAVASSILGWVLDAFDFFVVVFLFDSLADRFSVPKKAIVGTIFITLAMRPVGALLFGALADRFGRRKPLMACVAFFSLVTIGTGLAPTYAVFVVMRALYGIGMGGYWGVGASFAMEHAPTRHRGILSGLMQGGYPFGYLLAALGMLTITPHFGWRSMFFVGSILAVLIIGLTWASPESDVWKEHRISSIRSIFTALFQHFRRFLYLLLVMGLMACLSHGTQDLYPDFLKSIPAVVTASILGMKPLYGIPILYNIGAILGAVFFGFQSERLGRRVSIMLALALCLLAMPAWAFGASVLTLVLGSFVMQAGVQGAFGVIPAHLNELSPDSVRSLFPGFVYQLGVLIASPAVSFEFLLRNRFGYSWALTLFELATVTLLLLLFAFGPERRGKSFSRDSQSSV